MSRAIRYQVVIRRQHLTEVAQNRVFGRMLDLIRTRQQRVDEARYRLLAVERQMLGQGRRRLEVAQAALRHRDMRHVLAGIRRDLHAGSAALAAVGSAVMLRHRARLERAEGSLRGLSPLNVLDRGYSLLLDVHGMVLKSVSQVEPGEAIRARLADGELTATVNDVEAKEPRNPGTDPTSERQAGRKLH